MELDNQAAKQTYIKLLADTLKRKTEVLGIVLELTKQQEDIITSEPLDEEEFLRIVDEKEEQINTLIKLDDGFEQLYQSVKEELVTGRDKYIDDIVSMQELIAGITDASVELQAREKRNKASMEAYFATKRKDIRNSRASNRAVTNYYKSITKQQASQSIFYDKKK
jgi:tRNA U55 pseudouridine synthase TruB